MSSAQNCCITNSCTCTCDCCMTKDAVPPTNFLAVQSLTTYVKKVCNLYEYLMQTPQTAYDENAVNESYTELVRFRDSFSQSFAYATFGGVPETDVSNNVYDDAVEKIFTAYNSYLKKCFDLMKLHKDKRVNGRLFPLGSTSYVTPETGMLYETYNNFKI